MHTPRRCVHCGHAAQWHGIDGCAGGTGRCHCRTTDRRYFTVQKPKTKSPFAEPRNEYDEAA